MVRTGARRRAVVTQWHRPSLLSFFATGKDASFMGKRKKSTKPPPRAKDPTLERTFDCFFCGHEKTVESMIDRKKDVGRVSCTSCGAGHHMKVNPLTEPVDIYTDWIDHTVEVSNLHSFPPLASSRRKPKRERTRKERQKRNTLTITTPARIRVTCGTVHGRTHCSFGYVTTGK